MYTEMYALKYEQPNIRGFGFNTRLVEVREPGDVWRSPKANATFEGAVAWLVRNGWQLHKRSHSNGAGLKTCTELWERIEEEIRDPYEDCECFSTGCVVDLV
jgi:hypothetical protein